MVVYAYFVAVPVLQLLLLENVRFYKEEEKNDPEFAKKVRLRCRGTDGSAALHFGGPVGQCCAEVDISLLIKSCLTLLPHF